MHGVAFRLYDGSPFPICPINKLSVKGHIEFKPHSLRDNSGQVVLPVEGYGPMSSPEASG